MAWVYSGSVSSKTPSRSKIAQAGRRVSFMIVEEEAIDLGQQRRRDLVAAVERAPRDGEAVFLEEIPAQLPPSMGTTGSWRPWESRNRGLVGCGAASACTESTSKTPDIATTRSTRGAAASATSIESIAPCEKPTSATVDGA